MTSTPRSQAGLLRLSKLGRSTKRKDPTNTAVEAPTRAERRASGSSPSTGTDTRSRRVQEKARKRRKAEAAKGPTVAPLQTGVKRRGLLDSYGMYDSRPNGIPTTTRQAEALRLTVARRSGTEEALVVGIDVDTGEPVYTDPGSDYRMADGTKATTRVRLGAIGEGKSTEMKTSGCLRPIAFGRRSLVIDKKPMPGPHGPLDVGEYTPLARRLGVEPLRFTTDGSGMRINVLDPRISRIGSDTKGAGQTGLLRATLQETMGRPISELQGKALRVAHARAIEHARNHNRVADIRDMIHPLLKPEPFDGISSGELREWGLEMGFALERCIEEDLKGLIDGPTDPRVQLNSSLTCFDISTLPDSGPALGITMALIDTWTGAVQRETAGSAQWNLLHFLTEESWWLTRDNFAAVVQRNIKMSRSTGRINEFAFHHLDDLDRNSPAMSIIKEAGTVMIFRQDKDEDAAAVVRELSLEPSALERIKTLRPGQFALWQPGRPLRYVQGMRSTLEKQLTETDAAFISDYLPQAV